MAQNPKHTANEEARLRECEAIRQEHDAVRRYNPHGYTPAYQRDVLNALAKRYNSLVEKYTFDGLALREDLRIEECDG